MNSDQISGRKFKAVVDAVLNLTHDVQHAFNTKQVTLYLFLDVKGAFNHVLKNQLLQNLYKLNLPKSLIN